MRSNIIELTEAQAIERYTDKFFRTVHAETPAIPATYDGKYVLLAVIAVNVQATEVQMDAFEASVDGIAGVHKCHILAGPARIPLDRTPADHDLIISIDGGFDIRPTPAE